MKKTYTNILILIIGALLLLPSCKKWLDVSPKTQLKEEEQFSTEQGFVDALIGVYQKISSNDLYGGEMSYGTLEVLAQCYESKATETDTYGAAARYIYDSGALRPKLDRMWAGLYSAIAQCNYILNNTEDHREALSNNTYAIVKGEALGLRGFLHFDLLRLYGPAYLNGANASKNAIPYMTRFTVFPQQKLTVDQVLNLCEQDLKAAEALLSVYPAIDQIALNQNATSNDLFLSYRQNRLNYWAVKAALARLYQFKGDKAQALKYAKEVIDSQKFRFITNAELFYDPTDIRSDLTFTYEHIFSVPVKDLKSSSDILFKSSLTTGGDPGDLFSKRANLELIYESTTVPGYINDIRRPKTSVNLWNQVTDQAVYIKKYIVEGVNFVRQSRVPVIRLPEMYYIAAESETDPAAGVIFLNQVRNARSLPPLVLTLTAAQLEDEIMKEYRKEFYGEGQLWYYYKRKNILNLLGGIPGVVMNESKYIFPVPNDEIQFGK